MIKQTYIVEIRDLSGNVLVHDASTPAATFKGCLEAFHKFKDVGSLQSVDPLVVDMITRTEIGNKYEAGKMAFQLFKTHSDLVIIFKEAK